MATNDVYQPINCDDYESLELACQRHLTLLLTLTNDESLTAQAVDLILKKKIEYLLVSINGNEREIRLDEIHSFSHPQLGTIIIVP